MLYGNRKLKTQLPRGEETNRTSSRQKLGRTAHNQKRQGKKTRGGKAYEVILECFYSVRAKTRSVSLTCIE